MIAGSSISGLIALVVVLAVAYWVILQIFGMFSTPPQAVKIVQIIFVLIFVVYLLQFLTSGSVILWR